MPLERQITYDFKAVSRPCRIHSGHGALDQLGQELKRAGITRALVICGRSIAEGTDLIDRMQAASDGRIAGVFSSLRKDTPLDDVQAAADMARDLGADGLIAVGGGSAVQGARVTAILLAENAKAEDLATQYPDDGPAISPRLMADKLPIINVMTIGTTAQDRGGSPVKAEHLGRRLEFFDPKTRPAALFWDQGALATAPVSMLKATAAMTYWRALMDLGYAKATIMADLNRREVLTLATRICDALTRGDDGDSVRAELCVVTWLQNRAADDGAGKLDSWSTRATYAFSVALFNQHGHVSQGAANAAIGPNVLRELGSRDPEAMAGIADALGLAPCPPDEVPQTIADHLSGVFSGLGHVANLTALGIPRDSAPDMLENALRNFNADPNREFRRERDRIAEVLAACW